MLMMLTLTSFSTFKVVYNFFFICNDDLSYGISCILYFHLVMSVMFCTDTYTYDSIHILFLSIDSGREYAIVHI